MRGDPHACGGIDPADRLTLGPRGTGAHVGHLRECQQLDHTLILKTLVCTCVDPNDRESARKHVLTTNLQPVLGHRHTCI